MCGSPLRFLAGLFLAAVLPGFSQIDSDVSCELDAMGFPGDKVLIKYGDSADRYSDGASAGFVCHR